MTGLGASQCPTTSGRQSLSLALLPSAQPGPAPEGLLPPPGQRGVSTPAPLASWAGESFGACPVPCSRDSCTPGLRPDTGSTPYVPRCHQVSPGGEGQDTTAVLGGQASVTWKVGAEQSPGSGQAQVRAPRGQAQGDGGPWDRRGGGHGAVGSRTAGRSRRQPRSPCRRPVVRREPGVPPATRVRQAFRAVGPRLVGCSHCVRGPEHRPTPDVTSATAHDVRAGRLRGPGPPLLLCPQGPQTRLPVPPSRVDTWREAGLARGRPGSGRDRPREDRKPGPGEPEGHRPVTFHLSSPLEPSAGFCSRGTRGGERSPGPGSVLSATQTQRVLPGPTQFPSPDEQPGRAGRERCLRWKPPTGSGSLLFFFLAVFITFSKSIAHFKLK